MADPMGMPPMPNNPNMEADPMGMQQDPLMDTDMPMGDGESNEESTPKKAIQKLVGKLSQELRQYNDQEEDSELNKYVAGMIIPQASKGMTDDDKQDVINKIKKGVVDDEPLDGNEMEEPPMGQPQDSMPKMESRITFTKKMVNEIVGSVIDNNIDDKDRFEKKTTNKAVKRNNPFVANR